MCIYYSLLHESDLPEITLLVVDKNKQCNHSLHCLFWIITPLVFRCYSISIFSSCSLSVFSKRPVHRHFSWKIPETTIRREVSAVTSMNRGFREAWKNGKSFLRKNSGCRVIVHNRKEIPKTIRYISLEKQLYFAKKRGYTGVKLPNRHFYLFPLRLLGKNVVSIYSFHRGGKNK